MIKRFTFAFMMIRGTSKILLIILVTAVIGFDRHIAGYYHDEISDILSQETLPAHTDLPVQMCDSHEDISVKTSFIELPEPAEKHIYVSLFYNMTISWISTGSVWQPPERAI